MTALLSEIFLFFITAACELTDELWPQTHITVVFLYVILCIIIHTTRNLRGPIYRDILPIEWLLYYWRYLLSQLELYARYDQQVMDPNTHCNHFPILQMCVLTLVTRKLPVVCGCSTYRMIALLSEMSIVCVIAGCKIRMVSYAFRYTSQCLCNKPFVHIHVQLYLDT